ncbi:hypothetical protein Dimus_033060 [Dionaea muscipula]
MMGIQQHKHLLHHQPDPLVLELDHLRDTLKEKDNQLGIAQAEIKALRAIKNLKTRAVDELENELNKLDEKLRLTENLLQQKNLEIVKLKEEKKNALAAQFAAEATLRRVQANQKCNDPIPLESLLAPLEADIKTYKNEVASLLEDKKALERLTRTKETALLETEKILRSALERALIVEDIQNKNIELKKQVEICREEYRILEKSNRQKVVEVEKLSKTTCELKEALLARRATSNVIRDYQRQISELNIEMKKQERELARAKVSANRVATVVANEWKDDNDKLMPFKQWLEERRMLQAEMQRLREKLAITERTVKAEAQLKEKFKLRLRTLEEEVLKNISGSSPNPTHPRATASRLQKPIAGPGIEGENKATTRVMRRSLWKSKSMVGDGQIEENIETVAKTGTNMSGLETRDDETAGHGERKAETDDQQYLILNSIEALA